MIVAGGIGRGINVKNAIRIGMFCDLLVNDTLIIGGVICENANVIVRDAYLGFVGDIAFFDTQGTSDPSYTGLGSRWILVYLAPADLPAGVA